MIRISRRNGIVLKAVWFAWSRKMRMLCLGPLRIEY